MAFFLTGLFLFLVYAACLVFYRQAWRALPVFKVPASFTPAASITVIIPARNEEDNIGALLDTLLAQDYPPALYEVIVVDDHSTDGTADVVRRYKNVRLLTLADHLSPGERLNAYKKKAIDTAITLSRGELIVTTDADCLAEPRWLSLIAAFYQEHQPVFIAAPVAYMDETSFLKVFQSLDFMTLQGITGASVYRKVHTMCNGANLAYSKAVFHEVGGFRNIDAIASGDDMLLMHKMYQRYPDRISFLKSPGAIIRTAPMPTWKAFFNQRIRWASKADKYDDKRIIAVLALVYLWNVWFLAAGVAACFIPGLWRTWLGFIAVKTIVEMWYLYPVAVFFGKKSLLWKFPLAEPVHIAYTIIAGWLGKFGSYQWKGRNVK
ncbi:glycosyltransferase family 2 protein [Dinghuibacter silviterrae]|uniref:Cellulose synthase/poly-beta-1,6-N-acetylglucosamine synthase-like glycosyltransferase n=1 Tax=Dinghuibacter silviterrae TaxID=1539049 RepID=A0A4R8DR77_9BACT|nr:glycosyltransferase [Dinghuibacter silviterrae]TDW99630.1 cellulose synthase/poly-beta-1,6-N-acetylglucosamine synthase-like glycosyltransferase [Dinghuibacter silviterrae]